MKDLLGFLGAFAALAVVLAYLGVRPGHAEPAHPAPVIVPVPIVPPKPDGFRRRPHRDVFESPAPDGTQPIIDFPAELWFPNIGSKIDDAGMCVFTSAEFVLVYAGFSEFRGFRDWCAAKYPGGGWPDKLAKCVKAYCAEKRLPAARFDPDKHLIQGDGETDAAPLERCLRNGWIAGVTLYHSPAEYRGQDPIYHCTCCVHLDPKWGCTLDNNPVTKTTPPHLWKPREKWLESIKLHGKYWWFAVPFGPPPCPTN